MAREVFHEAATLLHNGLVLDDLDGHDPNPVVAGLCLDLASADPGAGIRASAQAALERSEDLHDPKRVSAAYLIAATVLQL